MKPVFQKAHAETHKDFLALLRTRGGKITFSYVYDDPGPVNLEFDLPDVEPDEAYLAFNLAEHGEQARRRLVEVGDIEVRAGRPSPRPVPHWRAHIGGVGNFSTAYSLDEARTMVLRSRAELKTIEKAFEKK
jgi:hypothetical protein